MILRAGSPYTRLTQCNIIVIVDVVHRLRLGAQHMHDLFFAHSPIAASMATLSSSKVVQVTHGAEKQPQLVRAHQTI